MITLEVDSIRNEALTAAARGDMPAAETICRRGIEAMPWAASLRLLLAAICDRQGRLADALEALGRPLHELDAEIEQRRGEFHLRLGQTIEAVDAFDHVLSALPSHAPAHFYRGLSLFNLGRITEAAAAYEAAIQFQPAMFEAHNNLGISRHKLAGLARSGSNLTDNPLLGREPQRPGSTLGFTSGGGLDAALACFDRAIALAPNVADPHNCRGNCLVSMQRPVDARAAFARCLEIDPGHAHALNNEAIFLHRDNRYADSLDHYERAIDIEQSRGVDFDDARYNRGLLLLTLGDFARGWVDYESRLPSLPIPSVAESPIIGAEGQESPIIGAEGQTDRSKLNGALVYVRAEQGYGDTLQFVRYLPLLREMSAKVVFECQPGLKTLLDSSGLCDEVAERAPGNVVLAAPAGSRSIFVQSLPHFFGTDFSNIPANVPYLRAPEERIEKWRGIVDGENQSGDLRVGIVWGGNQSDLYNRFRSCVLADFAPLAGIEGVHFFSLQKGPHAAQLSSPPKGMRLTHLGDNLDDFADTAAAMDRMDLIITIDTSMAHLAGALGKPTWTLLLWSADWRWFIDRVDSPWYPSMRLFRQPSPGAWGSLFEEVATELRSSMGTNAPSFRV